MGDIILKEGEKSTRLYIILEGIQLVFQTYIGFVSIFLLNSSIDKKGSVQKKVNQLGVGDVFGDFNLISYESTETARVIAQTEVEIGYMDFNEYERVIGTFQI